jgi:hypothetical protein
MHAHRSAVDNLHVAVVSFCDRGENAIPDTGLTPPHEAVVASRARAEFFGQRAPWPPGSQDPEDAVQHPPIVDSRNPTRLIRQQRLLKGIPCGSSPAG